MLTFEVRMTEQSGNFSLCLPLRAIRKMVDKLLVGEFPGLDGAGLPPLNRSADAVELMAYFDAEPLSQVELDHLREGDVLMTDVDADDWVQVSLDGQPTCQGRPGSLNGKRAIVIGPLLASARSGV